jgi:catechol 2,3-dioxygenase-like lactoylglutathione lyase family enzyme
MFTRLQPILFVHNLATEIHFYATLGFQISHQTQAFVALSAGESILFGLQAQPDFDPTSAANQMIWQIGARRVRDIHAICVEAKLPIMVEPTKMDWGEWTMAVESPNGYRVVFEGPA